MTSESKRRAIIQSNDGGFRTKKYLLSEHVSWILHIHIKTYIWKKFRTAKGWMDWNKKGLCPFVFLFLQIPTAVDGSTSTVSNKPCNNNPLCQICYHHCLQLCHPSTHIKVFLPVSSPAAQTETSSSENVSHPPFNMCEPYKLSLLNLIQHISNITKLSLVTQFLTLLTLIFLKLRIKKSILVTINRSLSLFLRSQVSAPYKWEYTNSIFISTFYNLCWWNSQKM